MILSVKNLNKQYKEKVLLNKVDFSINSKDKIAIVGVNGSGKSTLLKILLGFEYPDNKANDKYEIKKNPNVKIGYISQSEEYSKDISVIEYVKQEVNQEIQEYEVKAILNKLKIGDYNNSILNLSGGQRRKMALSIALLEKTDFLILDEPTNHLDEEAIVWLESYLKKYKGAILLVSHDRYFLNEVVDTIYELERGNLYTYENVTFEEYLDLKARRLEDEKAALRKNKSLYRKEYAWISRGVQARRTKSKDRIERFEVLKSKVKEQNHSPLDLTSVSSRIGTKTIELVDVSKNFSDQVLFKDFSYIFGKFERVGIVGPNGSGKTTLLNIIAQKVANESGEVIVGETVKVGYFSQLFNFDNEDISIIDYIKSKAENIETIYGVISAQKLLENFLFPKSMIYHKISSLSGGEKKRLCLVYLIMDAPNVLILDEPTNDFDVDTLLVLEEFIENFQGIVIAVSHDRYFLSKIVDTIFYIDSNLKSIEILKNYEDYLLHLVNKDIKKDKASKSKMNKSILKKIKFTFDEQKEFDTIDDDILEIENELKNIDEAISLYAQDFTKLNELLNSRKNLEEKLERKQERWIYLNEKEEQILNQNTKKT